jgi:molecular chaperone GrpE (heat shock protein)
MPSNNEKEAQKADEIESKVRQGASEAVYKVDELLDNASSDVERAARRAEDEVNKLKAELADLKRRAGPKIKEAENYLTSPTAISFYKGLVTGIALVIAYKKYVTTNSRIL